MRGRIARGFLLLLWGGLTSADVFAAIVETPLNSPVTTAGAGSGKVVFGIDYSVVGDRQLDGAGGGRSDVSGARITTGAQHHAKMVYAVNQYLNIYAKLGLTEWDEKVSINTGSVIKINFDRAVSWGIGATGGARFSQNWQAFYDLQFLATPSADVASIQRVGGGANNTQSGSVDVNEFHLSLGTGREFHTYYEWASVIFPYIGITFSTFAIDHNAVTWSSGSLSDKLETNQNFGLFAGIRIANDSNWVIRLEGHIGDENSFSTSLDYRF